jgi:hypothetical protein
VRAAQAEMRPQQAAAVEAAIPDIDPAPVETPAAPEMLEQPATE